MTIRLIDGTYSEKTYGVMMEDELFIRAVRPQTLIAEVNPGTHDGHIALAMLSLRFRFVRKSGEVLINPSHYYASKLGFSTAKGVNSTQTHASFSRAIKIGIKDFNDLKETLLEGEFQESIKAMSSEYCPTEISDECAEWIIKGLVGPVNIILGLDEGVSNGTAPEGKVIEFPKKTN